MAAIPPYRAEMIGLSERDRTLLRSLLQATQSRTGVRWDGGVAQPAIYFIDVDGQAGAEFWQSLSEAQRRDAAIVVSAMTPGEPVRWLAKPLRSASLLAALADLQVGAVPAALAQAATPAAIGPRVEPAAPAGPLRLLDVLDGPRYATAQALQSPHWPDLVLGSGNRHAMRTAEMDNYIYGFAVSLEVTHVGKYVGGPLDDELRVELDTLRWLALLYAPLAEIAERLPHPPARVRLSSLPPFGQLPHTLQHVRMAAWLMQHPTSVTELAETNEIDEDSVRRFLGACNVFGLLRDFVEPKPEPEAIFVPEPLIEAEPEPVPVAAPEPVAIVAEEPMLETAAQIEGAPATQAPPPTETLSVLEKLRATREQNRARVAAAIRSVSTN
ncbi:MAG TPA: hypothetical protein VFE67_18180 [Rudaea sp.]|nr:hypothetical protein [Rudaea sp.]